MTAVFLRHIGNASQLTAFVFIYSRSIVNMVGADTYVTNFFAKIHALLLTNTLYYDIIYK